jgi:hypothetical protein
MYFYTPINLKSGGVGDTLTTRGKIPYDPVNEHPFLAISHSMFAELLFI